MGFNNVHTHQMFGYSWSSRFLYMTFFVKTIKIHTDGRIHFFQSNEYPFKV